MVYKWVQDPQADLFCSSLVHLYSFKCWLLPAAGCWDMRYSWRQESVFGREEEQNEKSDQHQEEHFFALMFTQLCPTTLLDLCKMNQ